MTIIYGKLYIKYNSQTPSIPLFENLSIIIEKLKN